MALTIKHLNSDASFFLSFEPILSDPLLGSSIVPQPFTVLLDPWISGPSKVLHAKISTIVQKQPACIKSLSELPEPDLVIISRSKSDHCNEATLRQLPRTGSKTLILAEPATARAIRSWKYFDRDKVRTIERWQDPRVTGKSTVLRFSTPPASLGGQKGEVTVSWIPQKRDLSSLHGAIGLTYRPPPTHSLWIPPPVPSGLLTPPASSQSDRLSPLLPTDSLILPPSPPISPHPLRSVQSTSALVKSQGAPHLNIPHSRGRSSSAARSSLIPTSQQRPISILFSPHGISYRHIAPYATSHLVAEAALPLTALLHCMDSVSNPWWLGGNISAGLPWGAETASKLGARVWISAHDGDKEVRGLATALLRTRRYRTEEVEEFVKSARSLGPGTRRGEMRTGKEKRNDVGLGAGAGTGQTEVLKLASGEEIVVRGDGMLIRSAERGEEDEYETRSVEEEGGTETGFRAFVEVLPSPPKIELDIGFV